MSDYVKKIAKFTFERDSDTGMLIGPNGCLYDSEAEAMYYGQIRLCGCGHPNEVHRFLLECLAAKRDDHETMIDHTKVVELVKAKPEIVAEFVLHFLDDRNLTQHGGSVYGSGITERGKQVLEAGVMDEDT